jgi:hypothetical protein
MDVQTDERTLINIESYLIELLCNVESRAELNLILELLAPVQDALRHLVQEPICHSDPIVKRCVDEACRQHIKTSASGKEENYSWFVDRARRET